MRRVETYIKSRPDNLARVSVACFLLETTIYYVSLESERSYEL